MKILILILFLIPSFCFADFGNFFPVGKVGAKTYYDTKSQCETAEGQKCFSTTGKDMRRWKVGFRSIDIQQTFDCDDSNACQAINDANQFNCDINNEEIPTFDDKANWPGLDFVAEGRPESGWFLWCQKEMLIIDTAGSSQADADDAQKASDDAARVVAKGQRDLDLDQCVADSKSATLTLPQASSCIRGLVRELRGENVPVADL